MTTATIERVFRSPGLVLSAGFVLRLVFLLYGIYQDGHSAIKYTDIDYYVFTDAARAVSKGRSPYSRATYRYTPLLAWILLPTSWSGKEGLWFHSGKALFALCDLVAGWLIFKMLQKQDVNATKALKLASVWILNPMVANISTRGSSEGLLCALVVAILYAFETRRLTLAGILLGLAVHFKIYPFIYGFSMFWSLQSSSREDSILHDLSLKRLLSKPRLQLLSTSLLTFMALNAAMYSKYGHAFLEHTFFYHFTRTDHRHNFSLYNTLLYFSSARASSTTSGFSIERLAFLPQLLLSCILLPLLPVTRYSLATTMLAQTLAFVTFNKVCTSQYFLWYLIFLPLYLPHSSLLRANVGLPALAAWILGQAAWLAVGFQLEFLGQSTFVWGLFLSSAGFFLVNCWLLSIVLNDGRQIVAEKGLQKNKQP